MTRVSSSQTQFSTLAGAWVGGDDGVGAKRDAPMSRKLAAVDPFIEIAETDVHAAILSSDKTSGLPLPDTWMRGYGRGGLGYILLALLSIVGLHAQQALVNVAGANPGGAPTSAVAAFPTPGTTTGNLLVGTVSHVGANVTSIVTKHTTCSILLTKSDVSQIGLIDFFQCVNITGDAADTVTATLDNNSLGIRIAVGQFSGSLTASPIDVAMSSTYAFNSSGGATETTPTFSTTQANEVIVGAIATDNSRSDQHGAGYTILTNENGNTNTSGALWLEYKIVSSIQTNTTATFTGNDRFMIAAFTIKAAPFPVLTITKSHTGNFTQGQTGTYTVTVGNSGTGPTSGTVTMTETPPSGLTVASMTGTGWTCNTSTCTRADALTNGSNYPAITVTVNVGATAGTPQVNQVSASGGGSQTSPTASDSTTILTSGTLPGLSLSGATETQLAVYYTAHSTGSCKVQAADLNGGPPVNDLDANKFTGADTDLSRTTANGFRWPTLCGTAPCSGGNTDPHRTVFIGGHDEVKLGADGKSWYSTALQLNSQHQVIVICDSSFSASATFSTRNLSQGSNYPELPIPQPTNPNPGYPAPTIDWVHRDTKYIDPVTGVLQKVLSFPLDQPVQPQPPRTTFTVAYDSSGSGWGSTGTTTGVNWTNPANAVTNQASGTLAVTSTANAPLFLASNSGWVPAGAVIVSDEQAVVFAKGATGTPAEVCEICWSVDSGQTCTSDVFDTSPLTSTITTTNLPAVFPTNRFSGWGKWKTGTGTYDLENQSYTGVSISGSVITGPARVGNSPGFNTDRPAGTVVTLTGCATGSVTNPLTIAHSDSPTQITVNQSFTAAGCTFQEYASGVRIILKNSGTLSLSATYNSVQGFDAGNGQAASRDVCNPNPITDIATDCDGNPQSPNLTGRLCQVQNSQGPSMIYLVQDNGRMCLQSIGKHGVSIQHLSFVANPWIGAKAYMGSDSVDLWSVTKGAADHNYTEYVPGGGGSVPDDGWAYFNVTTGQNLNTQIANGPTSDAKTLLASGLWGVPDLGHAGLFGGNIQVAWTTVGGGDTPCIRAITDANYNVIQTYTSLLKYPFTWTGCHGNAATGSTEYTNLVGTPLLGFSTKMLFGPFNLPLTAIRKNGVFQSYTIPVTTGTAGTPTTLTATAHDLAFYSNMSRDVNGPYVTCSGGTGGWTPINGTFHATTSSDHGTTSTVNTFTLPVTTSGAYPGGITCTTSPAAIATTLASVAGNNVQITNSFPYNVYIPDGRSLFLDGDPISISSHPTTQYYVKATGASDNTHFFVYNDAALTTPATDAFNAGDEVALAEACPSTPAAQLMPNGQLYFDSGNLSSLVPLIRCLTIRVRSEPCSEYPAAGEATAYPCPTNGAFSSIKPIAVGDVLYDVTGSDTANHDHMLVLAKTVNSPTSIDLTYMRRYGNDPNWAADIGPPYCCAVHSMGWYPVAYPNMLSIWWKMNDPGNPSNPALYPESPAYVQGHHDVGPGGVLGSGLVSLAEPLQGLNDINAVTFPQYLATPVLSTHNNLALWAGDANDTMANTQRQSYPGHRQMVNGIESTWKTDATTVLPDGLTGVDNLDGVYTRTVTKITGFSNVYQITNPSPSGVTNIKLVPYLFSYGSAMLSDISGPADCTVSPTNTHCVQDANPGNYCQVFSTAGHDCIAHTTAGYAVGNIYFSSKIIPATGSGTCYANNNMLAVPCLIPLWPLMGQFEQIRMTPIDLNGTGVRRMTAGWALPLQHFSNSNWIPSSDGKWGFFAANPINGKGPNGESAIAFKISPWPASDGIDRSTFIQVPQGGFPNGASVRIKFGYAENGDPANFWCTTRQETCWTSANASPSNPFLFAGETQAPTTCGANCTIPIPAIPERIIFFQSEVNGVLGAVQSLAVPVVPPVGATVVGGQLVLGGKVVVQ